MPYKAAPTRFVDFYDEFRATTSRYYEENMLIGPLTTFALIDEDLRRIRHLSNTSFRIYADRNASFRGTPGMEPVRGDYPAGATPAFFDDLDCPGAGPWLTLTDQIWLAVSAQVPAVSKAGNTVQAPARPLEAMFAGQVRGVLAERVIMSTQLDPFLTLRALSGYSGLSVRKLREFLIDPIHPLPHYRVGGKILVRRSEFDAWITSYRQAGRPDVDRIVREILPAIR